MSLSPFPCAVAEKQGVSFDMAIDLVRGKLPERRGRGGDLIQEARDHAGAGDPGPAALAIRGGSLSWQRTASAS